jgi:7,8-dihydroneopterin aldolase/epimerase/oxygenase
MTDKLILHGVEVHAHAGLTEGEKEVGARLVLDIEMSADLSKPAETDSLEGSIDLARAYELIVTSIESHRFNLLEALTSAVANTLMAQLPLDGVRVRVTKPHPPIGGIVGDEAVELVRTRA